MSEDTVEIGTQHHQCTNKSDSDETNYETILHQTLTFFPIEPLLHLSFLLSKMNSAAPHHQCHRDFDVLSGLTS